MSDNVFETLGDIFRPTPKSGTIPLTTEQKASMKPIPVINDVPADVQEQILYERNSAEWYQYMQYLHWLENEQNQFSR